MFSRRVQISIGACLVVALFATMVAVNARLSWRPSLVDFGTGSGNSSPNHVSIGWRGGELWFLSPLYSAPVIDSGIKGFGQPNIRPAHNWNRAFLPLVVCQPLQQRPDGIGALCTAHDLFALAKSSGEIQIWQGQKPLRTMREVGRPLSLPNMDARSPAFLSISPDGTRIAGSSYLDSANDPARNTSFCMLGLVLFDVATGRQLARQGAVEGAFADVAWSPDSRELAGLTLDGWVFILNAQSGKLRTKFRAHQLLGAQIAWSPDGKTIVTATNPRLSLTPKDLNFDFKGGDEFIGGGNLHIMGEDGKMKLDISTRSNGETTWNGRTERTLKRFDALTGKQIGSALPLQTGAVDVAFSPDGHELALGEHEFALVLDAQTLKTKRVLSALPAVTVPSTPAPVCVAWSGDGATLATSTVRGITLWRMR